MWRRRTTDDISAAPKPGSVGTAARSATWDEPRRVEPYRSLPLSTIPERENSLVSNHRLSDVPTASSIYTASPEFGYTFDNPDAPAPLFSPVREPENPLPSPEPEKPAVHSARRSSLPVPRKALPAGSKVPVKKLVATYNDKEASKSIIPEPLPVSPSQTGMSFAERAARAGFSGLSIDIGGNGGQKSWTGTSGRIPVLEPIRSTPVSNTSPHASADRESTRSITPTNATQSQARNTTSTNVPYTSDIPDAYAFQFVADAYDDDEIKPTAPLKAGDKSASSMPQRLPSPPVSPLTGSNPNSPVTRSSSVSGDLHRSFSVVSAMTDHGRRASLEPPPAMPALPRASVQTPHTPPAQTTDMPPKPTTTEPKRESTTSWTSWEVGDDQMRTPHAQIGSRFSWTTVATSTPPQHTRTESADDSSIGRSPTASFSPHAEPIIMRKRPISAFGVLPGIKRKPTPSITSSLAGGQPAPDEDVPMPPLPPQLLTSKELPLSPPELESVDLVTALQAQLDDLAYRRRNLGKVIESLTQLQPQNPVIQDLSKRRETASKVALFEAQLAEVQRQEYDLGIRLCRAWKRRDQEAPTTLWIRRVTS